MTKLFNYIIEALYQAWIIIYLAFGPTYYKIKGFILHLFGLDKS